MFGTRTLSTVASLFLLLAAAFLPTQAQAADFSHLLRDTDVLHGTIGAISPETRTLILVTDDGTRQTIHYDAHTVVFNGADGAAVVVVPGLEAVLRCRRQVTAALEQHPDLCPVQLFADSVYLAGH